MSNKWQSRPKSKSLRSNVKKKVKTKNPYLEVDNRKYLEYKLGDEKRKNKLKIGKKRVVRHGVKGHTSKVEKQRNREKMETRRILRETRQWCEEGEEDIPVRGNHGGDEEEYTAKNRRKR